MAKSPKIKTLLLLGFSTLPGWAQDQVRTVPPGREVRDNKLLTPGLTDTWNLEVEKDEILWCIVSSQAFDPVLDLVDHEGNQLASHDGKGTRSELWLRMPKGGAFEFRVRPYQGSGGGQYSFWLQRYRTQTVETDAEVSHRFGREQWWHYRVALQVDELLVPTILGEGRITALFDETRKPMPEVHGAYRAPHDGHYIIRVEGRENHTHQFQCRLARQRPLPPSGPLKDRAEPYGLDVLRMSLCAGEAYVFDLAMPSAQCVLNVLERNPVPGRPGFVWTGSIEKGGRFRRWYTARYDCEIEILLRNENSAAAPYTASLVAIRKNVEPHRAMHGRLAVGGGDMVLLPDVAGQLLNISVQSDTFDPQIDILDPFGNLVGKADDKGPLDRNTDHTFMVVRPGRYRLLIFTPGGVGGGDYTLVAEPTSIPQVTFDAPRALSLKNQANAYAYAELRGGHEVWLSVRSRSADTALTVIDPDGNVVGTFEGGGRGGDVLAAFVPASQGRYTLQVHRRSGSGDCVLGVFAPDGQG